MVTVVHYERSGGSDVSQVTSECYNNGGKIVSGAVSLLFTSEGV